MNSLPRPFLPDDDLHWRVTQYISGDLTAEQEEWFEQQMLQDSDLCAAVAEASLLTSAIVAAGSIAEPGRPTLQRITPAKTTSPAPFRRLTAVVCAIGCCAGLMMLISPNIVPHATTKTTTPRSTEFADADFLVTNWLNSNDLDAETDLLETQMNDEAELNVPDWMLAGLSDFDSVEQPEADAVIRPDEDPEVL